MTQEKLEQIGAVLNNEDNAKALAATENTADTIAWFATQGVDMTEAEVDELAVGLAMAGKEGDLDEGMLENVTGGSFLGAAAAFLGSYLLKKALDYAWKWGERAAEKKFNIDINGDGRIG